MAEMHKKILDVLKGVKNRKISYKIPTLTWKIDVNITNTADGEYLANFIAHKAVCPYALYEKDGSVVCEYASSIFNTLFGPGIMDCPASKDKFSNNTTMGKFSRMLGCRQNPHGETIKIKGAE